MKDLSWIPDHSAIHRCAPYFKLSGMTADAEIIHTWLNEYKDKQTTYRAYQKEAERFLLWVNLSLKKDLKIITRQDFEGYFEFLEDPQPAEFWCAPKGSKKRVRGSKDWRPFVGPLSPQAIAHSISILSSLMGYLLDAQYINFNPLILKRKRHTKNKILDSKFSVQERILEPKEWQAVLETLETHIFYENNSDKKYKLKFIISILFYLGLRVSELEQHTWGAFRKINDLWWFYALGKGDKLGKIPVNNFLLEEIIEYRDYFGFSSLENLVEEDKLKPIIFSNHNFNKTLSSRQIAYLIKELGVKAYEENKSLEKLKLLSPHWIRHLSASMQDRAGVSFKHIKANLRHSADETTRQYVHAEDAERHSEMQVVEMAPKLR